MEKKYIYTPNDVFKLVQFLRFQSQEYMRILYLTPDNALIKTVTLPPGSSLALSFKASDVFRTGILCEAGGVILVHNHPSGNINPSKEDIEATKKLVRIGKLIGIEILDHIIVTKTHYNSLIKEKKLC
jgi:DNA repair protein RadC